MDQNQASREFFELADEFINLANKLGQKWPPSRVSAAMMFATARFNVFTYYGIRPEHRVPEAAMMDYYCDQSRTMLRDNLANMKPPG